MATAGVAPQGGRIMVSIFDGTRQLVAPDTSTLITVKDGNQNQISREFHSQPSTFFTSLPIFNNLGDDYTVLAHVDDHKDAGFFPVHVAANIVQPVDLMLLPNENSLNFSGATWQILGQLRPTLQALLAAGAADDAAAQQRYSDLSEQKEGTLLACLLNITTSMEQIHLPQGNALQYLKLIQWERIASDRFFAFTDPALLDQVRMAVPQGMFQPAPGTLHPGATSSFKQIQFGEANVQLTFHENDKQTVNGQSCILVEPDIDYFKDTGAHLILEVFVNAFGSVTDPRVAYVLRWIAGRRAGNPEFNPLYTIVKS